MKRLQLSADVRLWLLIIVSGYLGIVAQPGLAAEKLGDRENKSESTDSKTIQITSSNTKQKENSQILRLSEIKFPSTSARMLVQTPIPSKDPPSVPPYQGNNRKLYQLPE